MNDQSKLSRQIGIWGIFTITVGSIIGSGIFRSPQTIAANVGDAGWSIFAWVLGGILSLCGSLAFTELSVKYPETGGPYVFLKKNFGDLWGFAFGWANMWVLKPTVIASVATVFAIYLCDLFALNNAARLPAGLFCIILLTIINIIGVQSGSGTQVVLTLLKVSGILILCGASFIFYQPLSGNPPSIFSTEQGGIISFSAAMISVFFAYDGWTDSTFVAGEVKNPRRNLPIAIIGGTLFVIAIYVITNLAYFYVLSVKEVAASEAVGARVLEKIAGPSGTNLLTLLVVISTFGTVNGSILTGPRVTFAMAEDRLLFRFLAAINSKTGTPVYALAFQGVVSCIWLSVASGFEDISGWFATTAWLFYGLATATIFRERMMEKKYGADTETSYRTPLYPFTPLVFILVTVVIILSDIISSKWNAAAGLMISSTAFPAYYIIKYFSKKGK